MKNKSKVLNSIALVSLICVLFSSCAPIPADVTGEINEANQAIMSAYANGDANALAAFYTADAKIFPENSATIEGPQAIAGFFGAIMNMGIKKVKFEAVTAQSYGNMAVEEGKYTLFVEGDYIADQGKYIVTWKNEDGKWKVHRDIWNTNNPAPQKRALTNDTVMIVMNDIKADKVAQFEDFYLNNLAPAGTEYNAQMKNTVRVLRPAGQNKDGTFTYIYLIDPAMSNVSYDMSFPLTAKYGEEKALEYMKTYVDCLKEGQSKVMVSVQTDW